MNPLPQFAILNANYISKRLEKHFPRFRACLKTARRAAARDFGCVLVTALKLIKALLIFGSIGAMGGEVFTHLPA